MVRIASDHCNLIENFFEERIADLKLISALYGIEALRKKEILLYVFHRLQSCSAGFFDLGVFDNNGKHITYAGPYDLAGKDYAEAEWFKAVKDKGLYVSDEFLGYRNIPHFIIAIRRLEGNKVWYLRATIDTYAFNDLVENIRIGNTGEAYLVNRKGVFQSRRRSGGRLMETDPDFKRYKLHQNRITSFSGPSTTERRLLYAAGLIEQTGWVMVVRQAADEAYASLNFAVVISVLMIIGGGMIVMIMGFFLATNMANKLHLSDMEKQQMKTQLVVAGKLAEVGEMSAGLAHEINNPLQVMQSEMAMIKEIFNDSHAFKQGNCDQSDVDIIKDSIEQIGTQISRCGKITQGLLRFARKNDIKIEPVSIQQFLPEVVEMVSQRAQLDNIKIITEIDKDLLHFMSDKNQLQQVFLNLLNNAIYALKDNKNGEIHINCQQDKGFLVICVGDNGCGMNPEDMEKIFMPFFTTKPVGQGTGLGLSTVYGIVEAFGGKIFAESEINTGTVFTIRLPFRHEQKKD